MAETTAPYASPSQSPEGEAPVGVLPRIASYAGAVASFSILALALLLTAEVLTRGLFATSIRGLYEISELLIVVVVFLGIAQAEVAQNHVRVTIVTDRFPQRVAALIRGIALLIAGGFLAWMCVALTTKAADSFISGEFKVGLLNFAVWPSRTIVAGGIALLVAVCLYKGVKLVIQGARRPLPSLIQDEDTDVR
jgi:TRAP-type C4-dicarboxylate transport system permease small subunit